MLTQPPEEPKKPGPLAECEASMRDLQANPKSVEKFAKTYSAIKKAAGALPAEKRSAVLTAINAANLTGDVDALAKGLDLLRAGASDAR